MNRRDNLPPRKAGALRYAGQCSPRVTAKGQGFVAEEILARARAHDIPLHADAALVTLLSRLDLGEEIPETLYRAVAQVLAFAYLLTTPGMEEVGQRREQLPSGKLPPRRGGEK